MWKVEGIRLLNSGMKCISLFFYDELDVGISPGDLDALGSLQTVIETELTFSDSLFPYIVSYKNSIVLNFLV